MSSISTFPLSKHCERDIGGYSWLQYGRLLKTFQTWHCFILNDFGVKKILFNSTVKLNHSVYLPSPSKSVFSFSEKSFCDPVSCCTKFRIETNQISKFPEKSPTFCMFEFVQKKYSYVRNYYMYLILQSKKAIMKLCSHRLVLFQVAQFMEPHWYMNRLNFLMYWRQ